VTLTTVTGPAAELFSAFEVKIHLRIDATETSEDSLISDLIVAARQTIETSLRVRLINQTVRLTLNAFPSHIQLPIWPVQSIDNVTYINSSGVSTVLASSEYQLITSCKPHEIAPAYLKIWPTTRADFDAVTVDLLVGYGLAGTDIPYEIRQAVLLLVADFFENRENTLIGSTRVSMPFAVESLIAPHRFWI